MSADDTHGTGYGRFDPTGWSIFPVSRAYLHAKRAEELLADVRVGVYVGTPPNILAAQVHATLATAFATLGASHERRVS